MKTKVFLLFLFTLGAVVIVVTALIVSNSPITGAPPYGEHEEDVPRLGTFEWIARWKRPDGPPRVGFQVGHWKNDELPDELEKLRDNGGSKGGGKSEWEVNMAIAEETAILLRGRGVEVDILPATVPPSYWADAFIAIHADGSESALTRGFKVAGPWRDFTGSADDLVTFIETTYQNETGFEIDPNVSHNMRGYYAFSWWRNEHAIHPMTTAAIVETGFLTNPSDRLLLINSPEMSAKGIADGVFLYLESEGLLK